MRLLYFGAGLAALLAIVVGTTAWLTGHQIERGFVRSFEPLTHHGLEVTLLDYQRGWLSSQARTRWTLRHESEPVHMDVHHTIQHGPLPTGRFAHIRSTFQPTPALHEVFGQETFDDAAPPLLVLSSLGWQGSHEHVLSSPVLRGHVDDLELFWGGLAATVHVNADGTRTSGTLTAPLIRVTDKVGGEMSIEQVHGEFDNVRSNESRLWTGPASFEIDRIHARDPAEDLKLELNGILLTADSSIQGEVLDLTGAVEAQRVRFAPYDIARLKLHLHLARLDADALDVLARQSADTALLHLPPEAHHEALAALFEQQLPHLLARGPYLEIERFGGFLSDAGEFALSARIGHAPATRLDLFNRLGVVIDAHVPRPFMRALLAEHHHDDAAAQARARGVELDTEEFAALLERSVERHVAELEGMNLIVENEHQWNSEVRFENGRLHLNGVPADEWLFLLLGALLLQP